MDNNVFNGLMAWLNVETQLPTRFSKTACLAIIQLNIFVKEQINITTPFYDEIFKYSQSILANISSTKQ
jgi:hypothetical protein